MEITVTDNNSKEFLASELPLVLDFFASWCVPCAKIAPLLAELAEEYDGRVIVGKCDIEEAVELTDEYGIMSVPTVLFIKNGQVVDKFVGSGSKVEIKEKIEKLL